MRQARRAAELYTRGAPNAHTATGDSVDDKKIIALARKNAAKAQQVQEKNRQKFDATLDATRPAERSADADRIFKEMKRREF